MSLVSLILVLLFSFPFLALAGEQYAFQDLGPALTVGALNAAGTVVGSVLTSQSQAPALLTTPTPQVLAPTGRADGIQGQMVVGYTSDGAINQEAFLATPQRGVKLLGLLPGGGSSAAVAVNPLAIAVGYGDNATQATLPVVWWLGRRWTLPLPHGGDGHAAAISPFGRVVGDADTATGEFHETLWYLGRTQDLGTLGGPFSGATGVTDAPLVVGWSLTAEHGSVGFTWTPRDGMVGLPILSPAFPACEALAVNQTGLIVGRCSPQGMGRSHAVAWQNRQALDLNTVDVPAGWLLEQAVDVNASGQIAGIGRLNNVSRAWRLSPIPDRVARR